MILNTKSLLKRFIIAVAIVAIITIGSGMFFAIYNVRKSEMIALEKKGKVSLSFYLKH
jgi:hypothetical protein